MDRADGLIFLKDEEKTEKIKDIKPEDDGRHFSVRFAGSPNIYSYRQEDVYFEESIRHDGTSCQIVYNGKLFPRINEFYTYPSPYIYFKRDNKSYFLPLDKISIRHSCLGSECARNVLSYLKDTSHLSRFSDGKELLSSYYEKIDFIDENSVLAAYLSPDASIDDKIEHNTIIFPFGCNRSQIHAVKNAMENRISIIQGPPGTGKTQTILTIIANLLINEKTAEIVSNNNSAVDNVREKLESAGLSLFLAQLGKRDNKDSFLNNQTGVYPDMEGWQLSIFNRKKHLDEIKELTDKLEKLYEKKELLCRKREDLADLKTEKQHFLDSTNIDTPQSQQEMTITSSRLLKLSYTCKSYFEKHGKLSLLLRIRLAFIDKVITWKQSGGDWNSIFFLLDKLFYSALENELTKEISELEAYLNSNSTSEMENKLRLLSISILKDNLFRKYGNRTERIVFDDDDIWKDPNGFLKEYPIITSTSFSSHTALSGACYDYVIIDEASQCDIATGALSLLSARNAVIVGDSKQLSNIVPDDIKEEADSIFSRYAINTAYDYSKHSFLDSIEILFKNAPSVLLREHYRCHPDIIGFCNERFYDNQLLIMTEPANTLTEPISAFLTKEGFHSRNHMNLRQTELIKTEILPQIQNGESVGVITPYNANADLIQSETGLFSSTVHKFQGRELDTIIYSTSDDIVNEFSDDSALINVAVSRAKKHFILVASSNQQESSRNIQALIDYINYHNFTIKHSSISSVFDLLYSQYEMQRISYIKEHGKISEYDSENLMYALITDLLIEEHEDLAVIPHYPLAYLFRDQSIMNSEEKEYIHRTGTHIDFLIYRKIGKIPVVAIEVDGFHFHEKHTTQHKRDILKNGIFNKYGLTLLRFQTNGSNEKERLRKALQN